MKLLGSIEYPELSLNDDKTVHTSWKKKRLVTGLSLSSDGKVSLGRKKKRKIRTLVYKDLSNELTPAERAYLKGYLAYARSVEPRFIASLEKKYRGLQPDVAQILSGVRG